MLTCPVFFMAVRSSSQPFPARLSGLLRVVALLFAVSKCATAPAPPAPSSTQSPPPDAGEDPRKRSANVWNQEPQFLFTQDRALEVYPDGVVNSSTVMVPDFGLMLLSTTIPYSENKNFAETSHPFGIAPDKDWFNKPHTVTQDIVVTIWGDKSRNYVCMNRRGRVYGAVNYTDECYWNHSFTDDTVWTLFSSYKYSGERPMPKEPKGKNSKSKSDTTTKDANTEGSDTKKRGGKPWYLGLNKHGVVMKGYRTDKNKKNVWFLPKSRTEVILDNDNHRPEMPTLTPPPHSPFGSVRQKGTSQRRRGGDSPFTSDGRVRSSRGRKRKCNEHFVFPVLDGCGRRGARHRHGSSGSRRREGSRKHKKTPRKRHRQQKSPTLFT